MSSIYIIDNWDQAASYSTNDIVKYNNKFYYARKNVSANSLFSLDNFGGYYKTNIERPNFLWRPSFNSNININVKTNIIQFNEGTEQRSEDGINNDLLEIDLNFNQRDDKETRAIIHFLNERNGIESFFFTPPFPYEVLKIFLCTEWQHSLEFAGIHSINAKFVEKLN